MRNVWMTVVIAGAGLLAVWLGRMPSTVAVGPAQVVALEHRVMPVEWGRIAEVCVAVGQRVKAGELLARQETAVLEREIAVAQARLQALGAEARASGVEMQSSGYAAERPYEGDLAAAQRELEAAREAAAARQKEQEALRAALAAQRELLAQGLVRRDRVDELAMRLQALEGMPAPVEQLEARLADARTRLEHWKQRYSAATAAGVQQARVKPYEQRVAEQSEALRVLQTRLAGAELRAPADGVVVAVMGQAGSVMRPGEPVVVVASEGGRQVVAYVNEREGRLPQAGQRVRLVRRAGTREVVEARVKRVADVVGPLPQRFWTLPQMAVYGREVELEVAAGVGLAIGEALEATFVGGRL